MNATIVKPLEMTEELARAGFNEAREYFANPAATDKAEHARDVLKALSIYSRIRATRANEAAITFAIARFMGLEGEALAPLWTELTGRQVPKILPRARERSGGTRKQMSGKQAHPSAQRSG